MCLTSSGLNHSSFPDLLRRTTDTSPIAVAMALRLSRVLNCDPSRAALAEARSAALNDPSYLRGLWEEAGVERLLVEDGYPQPMVDQAVMSQETGLRISRVARLEPWIVELRDQVNGFAELEDAFAARAEQAIAEGAVAFKSIIAYRSGLDVSTWSGSDVESAFQAWRAAGWSESREHSKPVRDMLLRRALAIAAAAGGVPVHVHCGGGDPAIVLSHARPSDIFPLLSQHLGQPIVLIHSGWPWIEEAAYIASILPHVYLDTSLSTPWSSIAVDNRLELMLGIAPPAKVMYGSDEASEPEVIWLSSILARESLERVLRRAIDHGYLDEAHATRIGLDVLGGNARRLHGIAS
ncbi:amidohydrolase family protein [Streptosporangium sp. NPDC020072]|uniref:amidohydrolase family protein n=1 Tax=Streptosporangium sp. NPDC020072 TaxID=3154788 RepID=UPI0034323EBB